MKEVPLTKTLMNSSPNLLNEIAINLSIELIINYECNNILLWVLCTCSLLSCNHS